MNAIFWTAYCKHERVIAIAEIEKIINQFGYITNFKMFSDVSISIGIEIEKKEIDKLYLNLTNYMNLKEFELLNSTSAKESQVFLNVTFVHGTGNLRIESPAVPG